MRSKASTGKNRRSASTVKDGAKSKPARVTAKTTKSKKKYCLCRGDDDGRFMIACDTCNDWFHVSCVGMTKAMASKLKTFVCPPCSAAGKATGAAVPEPKGKSAAKKDSSKRARKDSRASSSRSKRRRKEDDDSSEHNESEVEEAAESDFEDKETASEEDNEGVKEPNEEEEENEYEKERRRRMEENQLFLQSLGLGNTSGSLFGPSSSFSSSSTSGGTANRKYTGKRQRWSTESSTTAGDDSFEDESASNWTAYQPLRKSRRLQNEPALDYQQIREQVVQERAVVSSIRRSRPYVPAQLRGFHGNGRVPATEHIVTPLSLASVGTTIWSLGRLYEGEHADKYYSSKQCMYRHPYPVGYRASAVKWGSIWIMEIHEGSDGPLFVVRQKPDDENEDGTPCDSNTSSTEDETTETSITQEQDNGEDEAPKGQESFDGDEEKQEKPAEEHHVIKKKKRSIKRFEGGSATQPWTKACISGPSPGSRVSGPLLFGFSDPLTVHLLSRMQRKKVANTVAESEREE